MTNYIGNKPADKPLSANDIPDLPATKITSGVMDAARIGSGTFADARISASSVNQHASTFDDNQIQTNLALLSFKAAVNGSLNKYNLQDNVVDEFNDNSGIDTSTSTNEALSAGAFAGVFSFDGAQTQIAQGTGTPIGDMTEDGGLENAFNGTNHPAASSAAGKGTDSSVNFAVIGKNWGTGNSKSISRFKWHSSNNDGFHTNGSSASVGKMQLFGNSVNDFNTATAIGSEFSVSNMRSNSSAEDKTLDGSGLFQYHWVKISTTTALNGDFICGELIFWEEALTSAGNMTLVSNATTAATTPTTSDLIFLMDNNVGTATLNTDIKGFISRDGGTTFTEVTLVDEGTYSGNTKIVVAHDVDISSQPSGTSMKYKIQTLNQSGTKITKISAVHLGWK